MKNRNITSTHDTVYYLQYEIYQEYEENIYKFILTEMDEDMGYFFGLFYIEDAVHDKMPQYQEYLFADASKHI